jgi:hypothetical protein
MAEPQTTAGSTESPLVAPEHSSKRRREKIHNGSARAIDELFAKSRPNSLNLIRLLLAAMVVLWHSYAVLDAPRPETGVRELIGAFPVNGFFAVSGFLIYRSWARKPVMSTYLVARMVRIYPAFWVCTLRSVGIVRPTAESLRADVLA